MNTQVTKGAYIAGHGGSWPGKRGGEGRRGAAKSAKNIPYHTGDDISHPGDEIAHPLR